MTYRNRLFVTDSDTNWVYLSGKNHVGNIRNILSLIDISKYFLFVVDSFALYDRDENNNLLPFDVYPEIYEYRKYAEDNNLKFIVIFEQLLEAPSYKYNLQFHIDEISNNLNIPTSEMIIFSGAHHQFDSDIKCAVSTMIFMGDFPFKNTVAELLPTIHFVSLSRLLRTHRIAASVEILDRNLEKFGLLSVASGHSNLTPIEIDMIPERYQSKFPMYIDGCVDGAFSHQHAATISEMNTAFINVVHETSFDYNFHYNRNYHVVWNATTYTEKSIKPFAWGQIPIFIATKNHDKYLRDLGFDLFDDIIDQSYNQEDDPMRRIICAIDELEKICNISIAKLAEFKQNNLQRFIKNRQIAQSIVGSRIGDSAKNLKKVLDTM